MRVNVTITEPDGTTTKINSPGATVDDILQELEGMADPDAAAALLRSGERLVTLTGPGVGPVVLAWRTREGLRVGLKLIPAGGYVKVGKIPKLERQDDRHLAHGRIAVKRPLVVRPRLERRGEREGP